MMLAKLPQGLIISIMLSGCGMLRPGVVLHPISTIDIIVVKKGETLIVPKDGLFLSKFYFDKVLQAKKNS